MQVIGAVFALVNLGDVGEALDTNLNGMFPL